MSAFGDAERLYADGEVESVEEFETLWRRYYPDPVKWHEVVLALAGGRLRLQIDSRCRIGIDLETGGIRGGGAPEETRNFLAWVLKGVAAECGWFLRSPDAYNRFVAGKLPYRQRYGKTRRRDLWNAVPAMRRFDRELGVGGLAELERIPEWNDRKPAIARLTAGDFFRCCELGYDANGCLNHTRPPLSARDKFAALVVGGDAGLSDLAENDPRAFAAWYEALPGTRAGPWRICGGADSDYIRLRAVRNGAGWRLLLGGSGPAVVVEVARMAIALHAQGVPFILNGREQMLRTIKGEDYVGILPEHAASLSRPGCFPDDEQVSDFINPWFEPAARRIILEKTVWYPPPSLKRAARGAGREEVAPERQARPERRIAEP